MTVLSGKLLGWKKWAWSRDFRMTLSGPEKKIQGAISVWRFLLN